MVADNLQIYYEGTDWSVADEMKKKHNKRQARFKDFKIFALKILAVNKKMEKKFAKYFSIFEVEIKVIGHVLPENNFRVIKVKKTGNYIVVPGRDETDGCLLFVGCDSEIFGEAGVCRELTTGNILKIFHASLNNFSCIEVAVILEKGQMITFSLNRSNQNLIRSYCWNGREIVCAQDKNI